MMILQSDGVAMKLKAGGGQVNGRNVSLGDEIGVSGALGLTDSRLQTLAGKGLPLTMPGDFWGKSSVVVNFTNQSHTVSAQFQSAPGQGNTVTASGTHKYTFSDNGQLVWFGGASPGGTNNTVYYPNQWVSSGFVSGIGAGYDVYSVRRADLDTWYQGGVPSAAWTTNIGTTNIGSRINLSTSPILNIYLNTTISYTEADKEAYLYYDVTIYKAGTSTVVGSGRVENIYTFVGLA